MNPTIKRLLAYCGRYPRWLIQGGALLLMATAAEVAAPLLIKLFIDSYLTPRHLVWPAMIAIGVGYFMLQLLSAGGLYLQSLRFSLVAQAIVQEIREKVFATAIRLPARYFDQHNTGSMISRITNDTEAIMNLYVQVIGLLLQRIVLLCGILISMALLDIQLMLICLTLIPAVALLMWLYQLFCVPIVRKTRSLLADINNRLNESLQGMSVIQAMRQTHYFADQFSQLNQRHWAVRVRNIKINSLLLRPLIDLFYMVVLIGILWVFARSNLSVTDGIQVGVLYAFISYLGRMIEPLIDITNQLNQLQQAMVAGERVFALLDEPVEPSQGAVHSLTGDVAFEGVSFSYDGDEPVLRDVSFRVSPGEMLALVGHTGSGKSTIISLLMGFYPICQGAITFSGHSLASLSLTSVRRRIGLVQQDPFIFVGTLADNLRLGREGISDETIWQALTDVQLAAFVRSLPKGVNTLLEEGGKNFSAGQRQLLSFARALVGDPNILILDEATASVDSQTEQALSVALAAARRGRITIAIAHRLSTIVDADEILLLSRGAVDERGTHVQLMAHGGHYAQLFEMQSQGAWLERKAEEEV